MSIFDEVLEANDRFARDFGEGEMPAPPRRHLAVVTCMDARIVPLRVFGLVYGDAHVIRNAGGRVTEDVVRSLLVSVHVLGVDSVAVVHHTECGMTRATNAELRERVAMATGQPTDDIAFHAIEGDPHDAIRTDVAILRGTPLLEGVAVRGLQYDVRTGRLHQIV